MSPNTGGWGGRGIELRGLRLWLQLPPRDLHCNSIFNLLLCWLMCSPASAPNWLPWKCAKFFLSKPAFDVIYRVIFDFMYTFTVKIASLGSLKQVTERIFKKLENSFIEARKTFCFFIFSTRHHKFLKTIGKYTESMPHLPSIPVLIAYYSQSNQHLPTNFNLVTLSVSLILYSLSNINSKTVSNSTV